MHRKVIFRALAAASASFALAGPALAGMADGAQDSLKQALAGFDGLLKEESAKTSPPRLSDPKAAPVLNALLERDKILGAHPYKSAELDTLLGVFTTYFSLSKAYIEFKAPDGKNNLADNEHNYQDELTRLADEMVASGGAISDALTDYVATTPAAEISEEKKMRLAKLRLGVGQMVTGMIGLLENPRYSKDNKVLLASALAEEAPYFSAILPVEDRKSFSQSAMATMVHTPPEAEMPINQFMRAMANEECTALCALK